MAKRLLPLATIALLVAACSEAPPPEVRGEPSEPPAGQSSIGDAGVYVSLDEVPSQGAALQVELSGEQAVWFQPESLRLARWLPESKAFELIDESRFDAQAGLMQGTVSQSGTYGVFGLSRVPRIRDYQDRICGDIAGPSASLGNLYLPQICTVILCAGFDAGAWSDAIGEQTGLPIGPDRVGAHFGNLCDLCLGRPGRVRPPECGIDVPDPGRPLDPPVLEKLRVDIPNGGRAVAVTVDPEDDDSLVVASETGGLFRSTDRADTWTHVSEATTFDYNDVLWLPGSPEVVLAAARRDTRVESGGGIWKSDDAGRSWTRMDVTPPVAGCETDFAAYDLAFESARSRVWAATECGVAYSDDRGSTWIYLDPAGSYNHDKTYAVRAPAEGALRILTDSGVEVTDDDGGIWSISTTGLPGNRASRFHNQIEVSPSSKDHLFWAFNYWLYDDEDEEWERRYALYDSVDAGANWQAVIDRGGWNRPPFVRVSTSALSGASNAFDVYFGNGGCWFGRVEAASPDVPGFDDWTALDADHCDFTDIAFTGDGSTPLLLTGDGGLHDTDDDGATWTMTGAGHDGYNALQITEITGQLHDLGPGNDLYFGTQDNDLWASGNSGVDWPASKCCEGFFIEVPRQPLPDPETTVTATACGPCGDFKSGPLFDGVSGWPDPPNDSGNPKLLKPENYVENTQLPGVTANLYNVTDDTGASWTPRYGFPEPVKAFPQKAGPANDPTVFTAFKRPGTTPDGEEPLGIKRIVDVLGTGTPVVSEVTGFGSLGTFPTMFAWYKPYGVDPDDPNRLMVPDMVSDTVQITTTGGTTWTTDATLTDLVTAGETFRFNWDQFVQVSHIAFDPDCDGHVMVGTRQAGIFRTFDGSGSWERVPGSEVIPRVSSFHFAGDGEVIASSYGRGLWRIRYECGAGTPSITWPGPLPRPIVWIDGVIVPLPDLDPTTCPECRYLLARDGAIVDLGSGNQGGNGSVRIDGGRLELFDASGEPLQHATEVVDSEKSNPFEDERLQAVLEAGNAVKGLYLDQHRVRGLVIAAEDVAVDQLPRSAPPAPSVRVDVSGTHGVSVAESRPIEVVGKGFDPRRPLEITIDGSEAVLASKPRFDDGGVFRFELAPILDIGGHTLRVRQETDDGVLLDVFTFNVTVSDEPRDDGRDNPGDKQRPRQVPDSRL